jgi:hypothetical protein
MEVTVRFRFNKITGEVEEFIVDDVDSRLPKAEHNREHERIATEIGRVVARNPGLEELSPQDVPPVIVKQSGKGTETPADEVTPMPERTILTGEG